MNEGDGRPAGEPQPDDGLDLRILTPGLSTEEIAAVTSVVRAMVQEGATVPLRNFPQDSVARWRRFGYDEDALRRY